MFLNSFPVSEKKQMVNIPSEFGPNYKAKTLSSNTKKMSISLDTIVYSFEALT